MNLRACFVLSSMILACLGAAAEPKKILFDAKHQDTADGTYWALDEDDCGKAQQTPTPSQEGTLTDEAAWSGALSAFGIDLAKQGLQVETLTREEKLTFGDNDNPRDLQNYSVYVVVEPNVLFGVDEKEAVRSFVQGGGGLFLIADRAQSVSWDSPRILNEIAVDFGIKFNNKSAEHLGRFSDSKGVIRSDSWLIPRNSHGLALFESTSIEITGSAKGHAWLTGGETVGIGVTFATSVYGKGRVAAVGDSSVVGDKTRCGDANAQGHYDDPDNKLIVLRTIGWLAKKGNGPENATLTLHGLENKASVNGALFLRADIAGVDIKSVKFFLDNEKSQESPRRTDLASPFEWHFDSTTVSNGTHTLLVRAYDARKKEVAFPDIEVHVNNPRGPLVGEFQRGVAFWGLITLLAAVAGLTVYRRLNAVLRVKLACAKDTPRKTIAFILESKYLPVRADVVWHSEPPVTLAATLDGEPIPAGSRVAVKRQHGESRVSLVFPEVMPVEQQIKVTAEIVAFTRFVRGEKSSLPIPRVFSPEQTRATNAGDMAVGEATADAAVEVGPAVELPPVLQDDGGIERATIEIVNSFVGQGSVDRARLREMLLRQGVSASIVSPYKVPESANEVFAEYWFQQDDRAGRWLRVPVSGGAQFIVIPFDVRSFNRELLVSHFASLYEGVDQVGGAAAMASVRFSTAACVARGGGDSYRVVRRGALASFEARRSLAAVPSTEVQGVRDQSIGDARLKKLENRVAELARVVQSVEDRERRRGPDIQMASGLQVDQWRDVELRLRCVEQRVDGFGTLSEEVEALRNRLAKLESLGEKPELSVPGTEREVNVRAGRDATPVRSAEDVSVVAPPQSVTLAPLMPAFRAEQAPSVVSGVVPEIPALPKGWAQSLSLHRGGGSFGDASSYARTLGTIYNELRALKPSDVIAVIVHLLPSNHGSDTLYEVHFDNVGNGPIALRCDANPTAYTPAQQFFIAFRSGSDRVSVVCIPGEYSAVSFDLTPLIGDTPGASFRIDSVTRPALLEPRDDGRYRVAAPMMAVVN